MHNRSSHKTKRTSVLSSSSYFSSLSLLSLLLFRIPFLLPNTQVSTLFSVLIFMFRLIYFAFSNTFYFFQRFYHIKQIFCNWQVFPIFSYTKKLIISLLLDTNSIVLLTYSMLLWQQIIYFCYHQFVIFLCFAIIQNNLFCNLSLFYTFC